MNLITQFNNILPLACEWVKAQQVLILQKGNPLSPQLLLYAKEIGIIHPDKVRIFVVPIIPRPEHPTLKAACDQTNFLTPNTGGLTLHYGIYVRSDCISDIRLHVHELVHVVQYERLGGVQPFLQKYLREIVTFGYNSAPMEQEAINVAKRICGFL